jgi:hypothetical protein
MENKSAFIFIMTLIYLICNFESYAQIEKSNLGYSTLEEKVSNANVIIEGLVLETKGFKDVGSGAIYTSALIRVLKIFKGSPSDTIIELIFIGGRSENDFQVVSHAFHVGKGASGIYFLKFNNTGILLRRGISSYIPSNGPSCFIEYHYDPFNHPATAYGTYYDNIEKDILQPIKALTGQKRKVMGLNSFEVAQPKK